MQQGHLEQSENKCEERVKVCIGPVPLRDLLIVQLAEDLPKEKRAGVCEYHAEIGHQHVRHHIRFIGSPETLDHSGVPEGWISTMREGTSMHGLLLNNGKLRKQGLGRHCRGETPDVCLNKCCVCALKWNC